MYSRLYKQRHIEGWNLNLGSMQMWQSGIESNSIIHSHKEWNSFSFLNFEKQKEKDQESWLKHLVLTQPDKLTHPNLSLRQLSLSSAVVWVCFPAPSKTDSLVILPHSSYHHQLSATVTTSCNITSFTTSIIQPAYWQSTGLRMRKGFEVTSKIV